jgi:hypothetical protein
LYGNGTSLATALPSNFPTLNQNTTGNASTVTTNANLTGDVTSVGNATTLAASISGSHTFTGAFVANSTTAPQLGPASPGSTYAGAKIVGETDGGAAIPGSVGEQFLAKYSGSTVSTVTGGVFVPLMNVAFPSAGVWLCTGNFTVVINSTSSAGLGSQGLGCVAFLTPGGSLVTGGVFGVQQDLVSAGQQNFGHVSFQALVSISAAATYTVKLSCNASAATYTANVNADNTAATTNVTTAANVSCIRIR